jgi:hypothetical protein
MYKHQNSTLEIIIAALFIGTVLALAVVVIITQEANAAVTSSTSLSFEQTQTNKCSGFAGCSNTGTIIFGTLSDL